MIREEILINEFIPAIITIPEKIEKAVIMLHGTGSDKNEVNNAYVIASENFCKDYNILSLRLDFRGSGKSNLSYREYNINTAVYDVICAFNYIKDKYLINDISILGFSQGGSIAMIVCGLYPELFNSLITWSGALNLFPSSTFTNEMYEIALKKGYCELKFDFRDSLYLDLSWFESIKSINIFEKLKNYKNKILVIQGEDDILVDKKDAEKIYSSTENKESKLVLIKNVDHIFNVFKEKELNTLNLIIKKTGDFIKK